MLMTVEPKDGQPTRSYRLLKLERDKVIFLPLTMDQALGQFFQRDKLFKEVGDDRTDAGGANVESAIKAGAPPAAPAVARTSVPTTPPPARPGVPS